VAAKDGAMRKTICENLLACASPDFDERATMTSRRHRRGRNPGTG
jgi:hypothetical protein